MDIEGYKEADRKRSKARGEMLRALVQHEKSKPCFDCGRVYPFYVMDFDHKPGHEKEMAVSKLLYAKPPIAKLMAEIAKCDLVCANCHRERTYKRKYAD